MGRGSNLHDGLANCIGVAFSNLRYHEHSICESGCVSQPTVSSGLLGDCDCLLGDFSGDFRIRELTSNGRYFELFVVWGESVCLGSHSSS